MKLKLNPGILRLAVLAAAVLAAPLWASAGFGDGADGPLTVGAENTVTTDSVRTIVTGTHAIGDWGLQVADITGFSPGDEILLITMVDPELDLPSNTAGTYSTHTIADTDTALLVLGATLLRPVDGAGGQVHQVIRVPHYTDVTVGGTLTCSPWDGQTGGVLFFRASGTVTVDTDGAIEANAKGYRGHDRQPDGQNGYQGESIRGTGVQSTAANATGGGGGTMTYGGGGGGGHAAAGEAGTRTNPGAGGAEIGTADLERLYMGGAGGTGGDNDSNTASNPNGGHGGGVTFVSCRLLTNSGTISADGGNGNANAGQDGGAGGGAGGSVYVRAAIFVSAGTVAAGGGVGFVPTDTSGGEGGDGAQGRIRIDTQAAGLAGTVTPAAHETTLAKILHSPLSDQPVADASYPVEATVQDADGAPTAVVLWYRVDDGAFTSVAMASGDNVSYTGAIPPQPVASRIEYYIQATMVGGDVFAPAAAPTQWHSFAISARPPTNPDSQPNDDGSITLTWNSPSNVTNLTGYAIYRSEVEGTPPSPATLLDEGISEETYADVTPQDFHTYYYQIAALYDISGVPSQAARETSATANNITVTTIRGVVELEGQSNFANITIDFQPTSESAVAHAVQTNAFGAFETQVVTGRYTVVFSKANYRDYDILIDTSLLEDTDLDTSTLYYLGTANVTGNVSGTWDGIVTIAGDVTVPAGDTLTVEPGTDVRFLGNYSLFVLGTLVADGGVAARSAAPILFTSLPRNQIKAPGQWQGIDLTGASAEDSILRNIIVEYAVDGIDWTTCSIPLEDSEVRYCSDMGLEISDNTANPAITNVVTHHNAADGIYVYEGNPTLVDIVSRENTRYGIHYSTNAYGTATNCEFRNNSSHGIYLVTSCSPTIDNCQIIENGSWGVRSEAGCNPSFLDSTISDNAGYGIRGNHTGANTWSYPRLERCTIERNTSNGVSYRERMRPDAYIRECTIRDNGASGIQLEQECDLWITDNIITDNALHGIYIYSSSGNDCVVKRNVIAYNATDGIYRYSSGSPTFAHNTIYGNTGNGIYMHSTGSGTETFQHNIIVNNGGWGIRLDTKIETFSYNNVYENAGGQISNVANLPQADHWVFPPGSPTDSYANRSEIPGLSLSDAYDLALLPDSTMIDTGGTAILDPDGSPADLGALYRDYGNPHTISATHYADQTVDLEWEPVTATEHGALTGYNVYYREAATRADYTLAGATGETSLSVSGLTNNTLYEFAVTGDFDGGYESPIVISLTEKPGEPVVSFSPIALNVDVPEEGRTDDLTMTNTGTRDLDIEFVTGRPVGSAQYDGSGDYSSIGNHAHHYGMTSLTLECWVRRKNDGHIELISKHYQVYALYINSSNCLGMYKGFRSSLHQAYSTDYVVPANEWHHVAAVWSGKTITFYTDGQVVGVFNDVPEDAIPSHARNLELGRRAYNGGYYLNGNLAECRIWNVARTQAEIQRSMLSPLQGSETGLVGYWPLDTDHQFTDLSPYAKNAGKSGQTYLNTSVFPPTYPQLPVEFPYANLQTIAPGAQGTLSFTFPDTGETGTFTYNTPVFTNVEGAHDIDYELSLTYGTPTPSSPVHFSPVADTGVTYDIVVNSALLDGAGLDVGDEIGVFDGDLCVGAAIYDASENVSITTYQGVPAESKAGFTPGNTVTFTIFDASASLEGTTTAVFSIGDGTFGYGLFSAVDIEGTIYKTLQIDITANAFNLLSFNLLPRTADAATVFGGLGSLAIAHDDAGHALIPEYALDSIRDIDFRKGYHVFCSSAEALAYEGTTIDPGSWAITLKANQWNSIAFLGSGPQDVTTAFPSEVIDRIDIIQDAAGHSWIPSTGTENDIGNLLPGVGYEIAINGDTDVPFSYQPGQPVGGRRAGRASSPTPAFTSVPPSGLPYTVLISSVSLAGAPLPVGASIGVFDGDVCVGATVFQGGDHAKLVAWERYPSLGIAGFAAGNEMQFRISVDLHGQAEVITPDMRPVKGNGTFDHGAYAIVALDVAAEHVGPVIEMVEVVDPSETVSGVTNDRLVHLHLATKDGDEASFSWLITETAERPSGSDPRWQLQKPANYTIQGNEGDVGLFIWTRDASGRVSLLHNGSHQQIVLDLGLTFTIKLQNARVSTMTCGQWRYATTGFDANLDEELPAPTRSGEADVFFLDPDAMGNVLQRLIADFRPLETLSRWQLRVEDLAEGETCSLEFGLPDLLGGKCLFLQERVGDALVGNLQRIIDTTQITIGANGDYELVFTEPIPTQIDLSPGWNLVSLPASIEERIGSLFRDSDGAALKNGLVWLWDAADYRGLTDAEPMQPESGGWVFSSGGGTTHPRLGVPSDGVIALTAGWNLIGPTGAVKAPGKDEGVNAIWGWNADEGIYELLKADENLEPYHGYWIHATEATRIRLDGTPR
ncbi:MAG: hypothetical protein HN742_08450 [Lentisphaerae bacterium]|nr:hypothetical protein [Lentisphaerota bacterium]MBT5610362.1 hypothetical protein [Lentisphaerota bacterium]MBT7056190.1 hypothetical protein [Lentisphaerota bacterium]MBT7841888.1 hypothetical protein [Lentisphaerota bacterium]